MNPRSITRRNFLRFAGCGAAAAAMPAFGQDGAKARRPNVVLIMADDRRSGL
ncbi:MAG: twin-arginine translocation signal domain-containing protein [Nitrospiraceae bacterium]|nr:twin-arginine translocation signal domain-containing protein [Nitrospiraceae bacterium]